MNNLKEQMEIDIKNFLDNIERQSGSDRIQSLRDLFTKHLHLNTCDLLMDKHDLQSIISSAKSRFANDKVPIHLGNRKTLVYQDDLANFFVIEATVEHLNKNECLKKLPKFDKREG